LPSSVIPNSTDLLAQVLKGQARYLPLETLGPGADGGLVSWV